MKDLQEHLENEFKWFHSHPELSYQEYETTKRLKELLTHHGIEVLDLPLETGLVAIIRGKHEGSTIALRSDIDALPVNEETDLEWKSLHEGKMHACGHDFHLTTIYGVALLLNEKKDQLAGNVKLIFQPAEESSLGALKIIETGEKEEGGAHRVLAVPHPVLFPAADLCHSVIHQSGQSAFCRVHRSGHPARSDRTALRRHVSDIHRYSRAQHPGRAGMLSLGRKTVHDLQHAAVLPDFLLIERGAV